MGAFRQQNRISHLIANNLSNAQTPGFKKEVPVFHQILSDASGRFYPGTVEWSKTAFQQGSIQKTGNPLDMAIEGEGFFKVKTPLGIRYTRAGSFIVNREKVLTNADGFPVLGKQGEIMVSGQNIAIERNGTVKADGGEIGQIALVTFPDLDVLKKEGHTLYSSDLPEKETEVQDPLIHQGSLELSNANAMEEMVNFIDAMRTFESCLKIIQSQDEMDGKAVNELGRI
jgi:flagellar basal-body rod protein FlgG